MQQRIIFFNLLTAEAEAKGSSQGRYGNGKDYRMVK